MSFFKTKAIILKINKLKDKDFLYTIFSDDYGKIRVVKKLNSREKTLDLGYLINGEIETSKTGNIHKIKNIKILREFNCQNKQFSEINSYLEMISLVYKNFADGNPVFGIYDIFEILLSQDKLSEEKIILARLKIKNIIGELDILNNDSIIEKILKFINANNFSKIVMLRGIDEEILEKLKEV